MAILNLVELIGMQFLISFSQLWSVLEAYLKEGSTTLLEAKHFTKVTYWWQPSKPATSLVTSKVLLRNHPWHIGAIGVGQPNHTQRLKGERFLPNIYFRDICTMTCPFGCLFFVCQQIPKGSIGSRETLGSGCYLQCLYLRWYLSTMLWNHHQNLSLKFCMLYVFMPCFIQKKHIFWCQGFPGLPHP